MSVTLAEGFVAAGLHAGIKAGGRRDMSLLATDDGKPVPTAAVFTQNKFRAPPVEASLERLNVSGGMASGVIVNSGNANAGTLSRSRLASTGATSASLRPTTAGRCRPPRSSPRTSSAPRRPRH